MDFIDLYHRQQIEGWRGNAAGCPASRNARFEMADRCDAEIAHSGTARAADMPDCG